MTDSWLRDLESLEGALRISDGVNDFVIASDGALERLSPSVAVMSLEPMVRADPRSLAAVSLPGGLIPAQAGVMGPPQGDGEWLARIRQELESGTLVAYAFRSTPTITAAELAKLEALRRRRSIPAPPLRPRPPPPEEPLHRYPIRVIDDTNLPVGGVRLKLEIDGTPRMPTTDAGGLAAPEWYSKAPASLRVLDQAAIEQRLQERWKSPRHEALPTGPDVHEWIVGKPFPEMKVPADRETTLVLCRVPSQDWIEIDLEWAHGALYCCEMEIQLANGESRRVCPGTDGVLRLDGIPPGQCRVNLHGARTLGIARS